uniref:Reverse transcriptase zinc-binding domain-containing protein n=1 Tax=Populus alba TaxID=43335 RepID=A0A4U5R2T6_POPAL|nr:hypothetical protein D5086_0000020700 [Populus alba]
MSAGDRVGGDVHWPSYQNDFSSCINHFELLQVPFTGLQYSWHNGQIGSNTIQKKLDWVFGNSCLFSTWPATNAIFQPRSISDHSAIILSPQRPNQHRHNSFKFLNIWADRGDFLDIVASSWQLPSTGNPMYQLTTKLSRLKAELRKLSSDFLATVASSWQEPVFGNPMFQFTTKLRRLKTVLRQLHLHHTSSITHRVAKAKTNWEAAQFYLDQHPTSSTAQSTEREMVAQYMQLCKDEESYFKQKSRVQWLQLGDRNTSFFHKSLLHRQVRNKIHSLQDENGTLVHDPHDIGKLASTYFENILTATHPTLNAEIKDIFPNTISEASKSAALTPITDDDIKEALFSIPDSKAPGPDGYNALFYKTSWDIIRLDFLAAIRFFFSNNCLPRCVNATRVALVPKTEHPASIISGLRNTIIEQLGIQETTLPVKYLGVPLLSSRLTHRDCLPIAGKNYSENKVVDILLPHLCWPITIDQVDKESMWSTWIQANLLRGKSFWQVTMPSNPSWSWRKILQSRDWCRGWFINRIGNGNSTSLWFDYWLPGGLRLIDNYSLRTLTATGLMWNARGNPSGALQHKISMGITSGKTTIKQHASTTMVQRPHPTAILHPLASKSRKNLLQWASATYGNKIDVKHLIACLLLSATVYQLWYERNNRIFSNQFQVATTIAETVFQQVRMHITSMEFRTIILTSICAVWGIRQPHQNLVPVADS